MCIVFPYLYKYIDYAAKIQKIMRNGNFYEKVINIRLRVQI